MKKVLRWIALPFIVAVSYALMWGLLRVFEMSYGYFMPSWNIVNIGWDVAYNTIPVAIAIKTTHMASPSLKKTATIIATSLFVGLIISYMVYVSYRNALIDNIILGTGIVGSIIGCLWSFNGDDE